MTEPLDPERFRALADAYGSVVARWPEHHRDAAARFATSPEGAAVLARALALDERLDAWQLPAPSPALVGRIMAAAPTMHARPRTRLRWCWSGLGLAAALAGAVAGTTAVAMVAPVDVGGSTSFGDVAETDG